MASCGSIARRASKFESRLKISLPTLLLFSLTMEPRTVPPGSLMCLKKPVAALSDPERRHCRGRLLFALTTSSVNTQKPKGQEKEEEEDQERLWERGERCWRSNLQPGAMNWFFDVTDACNSGASSDLRKPLHQAVWTRGLYVLIPKTIGNRKRDCAWGCARGKSTTWENLQIEKHKSVQWAEWTPSWFVLSDLQIFSGGVYPPSATSRTISFSISNSFWY